MCSGGATVDIVDAHVILEMAHAITDGATVEVCEMGVGWELLICGLLVHNIIIVIAKIAIMSTIGPLILLHSLRIYTYL